MQTYPVAPPGTSAHEFGYAFDMVVSPMEELPAVGAYWKSLGGRWGGEFNDPIHFEYPGFSAPKQHSLGYTVGTTAASLLVPLPASTGLTVAKYLKSVPWYIKMNLFAGIPGLENYLEWTIDELPDWIRDILTF